MKINSEEEVKPQIPRVKVKSSMLIGVGYAVDTNTLQVEYNNNTIWNYYDVPEKVYDDMLKAESIGKYFLANIKSRFECEKI